MYFKKRESNNYNMGPDYTQFNDYDKYYNANYMYNPLEENRILLEIKENRRRINNLAKRIIRLENYLRIRDTSDYSILDDDN